MSKKLFDNTYLSSLCLELSLILKAGISINEGFLLIAENEKEAAYKSALEQIFEQLELGTDVSTAMDDCKAFPKYMIDMIRIGEQTGNLESVFFGLSAYYDRQESISSSIRSAVVYPLVLFIMMITVITVLVTEVLPIFSDVFAQLGASMSPLAMAFMNFGAALSKGKCVFIILLVLILVMCVLAAVIPGVRQLAVRIPSGIMSGTKLAKRIASARFASAMAMGFSAALDVDSSLEMAARLNEGSAVSSNIQRCRKEIDEGRSFYEAIEAAELFAPVYCRMLSIGVKAGAADSVMEEIARRSQADADAGIERAVGRVEPVLVVVMAVLVGLVLMSVMLPLMGIMSSIG